MIMRGAGTDAYYVLEVDPATGQIPVSATVNVTIDYSGPTGDPVPGEAAYVGGIDSNGDLQGLSVTDTGLLNINATKDKGAIDANTLRTATVLTDGNDTAAIESNGALRIEGQIINFPNPVDVNLGTPGASTVRTAAMLGVGSTAVSNSNPVPISDAGASITVDGTVAATQSGTWNIADITGTVSLPTGAATETTLASLEGKDFATESTLASVATEATLANVYAETQSISGSLTNIDGKLPPALGPQAENQSLSVVQAVQPPSPVGRSSVLNINQDISSLTDSAYVEIEDSTTGDINWISAFESSGNGVILATGASSSEVDVLYIPPGGFGMAVPLAIPSGTRLSIKALLDDNSSGNLIMNFLE